MDNGEGAEGVAEGKVEAGGEVQEAEGGGVKGVSAK